MKSNIFKIIFIVFVIILIALAIYISFKKNDNNLLNGFESINKTDETIISKDLRVGIIEFDNINPILSNNKNVQDISRLIFDSLFTLDSDYKLKSALAQECSKIEDKVYIIKLREDIKWHDNSKFDISDVIFTIDMLKELGENSIYYYNIADITEIEEIDEYTLKIVLNNEIPYFEYNLIFPIVSSKYYNSENFLLESTNEKPIGTGKFYISNIEKNCIILKKNTNNWEKTDIQLDTITLMLYDSLSSTINAFKEEQVDLFTTSNINIEDYLKDNQYNYKKYINRKYNYIAINCKNSVLSNKEVRQAINLAIDKKEIASELYNESYTISNFPTDFGSYVYDNNNETINSDQNDAKNLLLDEGWKYSSKKWWKIIKHKYTKIDFKIVSNKANKNTVKIANEIKEQLTKLGMKVTVIEATQNQYNNYINKKNYDLIVLESNYGYSPSLKKYFGEDNIANYSNEEIDSLLENIENAKDDNDIREIYSKINDIYNDEVPYISLFFNNNTLIYSTSLKGDVNPNSYYLFYGIENWYREYKK